MEPLDAQSIQKHDLMTIKYQPEVTLSMLSADDILIGW
jgi:hypothetical protein